MRRVLKLTEADLAGLSDAWDIACIYAEIDERGAVTRELGFDEGGNLIHRHPGEPTRTKYGVFDLTIIAPSSRTDIEPEEFDRLWSA